MSKLTIRASTTEYVFRSQPRWFPRWLFLHMASFVLNRIKDVNVLEIEGFGAATPNPSKGEPE